MVQKGIKKVDWLKDVGGRKSSVCDFNVLTDYSVPYGVPNGKTEENAGNPRLLMRLRKGEFNRCK